jgi:hypothetical protein
MIAMNILVPLLGEITAAQGIFLAGLALLIVILMVRSRRHFRQVSDYQVPRADARSGKSAGPPAHPAIPTSREFEQWEVAMHDLARDLSGQLDSKIRVLEILIREADKASSRLEMSLTRARGIAEPPREMLRSPANGEKASRQQPPSDSADKQRFERIYALADAGLSPAKIASQIGSQLGEVELILGLRGERRGASA